MVRDFVTRTHLLLLNVNYQSHQTQTAIQIEDIQPLKSCMHVTFELTLEFGQYAGTLA